MRWARNVVKVVVHPDGVKPKLFGSNGNIYSSIPLVGCIGNSNQFHLPALRHEYAKRDVLLAHNGRSPVAFLVVPKSLYAAMVRCAIRI